MSKSNIVASLALSLSASVAGAAGPAAPAYNIGDAVKGSAPPAVTPVRPEAPPAPVIRQEAETPLTLNEGQTLLVREFKVEGADFLAAADVAAQLAPFQNRALTLAELQEAANRITVLCRQKGYLVARAYLPKQDARNGVLLIKVVVGQYGNFQIKNSSRVNGETLIAFFEQAKASSPFVTQDSLERSMLLVGDLPGAQLPQINIAPGTAPGTSDFLVEVPASERLGSYVVADNYGSRFTGKGRLSAGLDVNSPFSQGDRLSLSGLETPSAGLQNARAAYGFPIGSDGLRSEVAVSRTTYKLGDEYADLDASGSADSLDATLSYALKRSREDNITLSLNLASKRLRDDIAATATRTSKSAQVSTLGVQGTTYTRLFGLPAYLSASGSLALGQLHFDDPAAKALNRAGANTVGRYSKVNLNLAGYLDLTDRWSLSSSLQMQQSLDKNLDGSEQLSISGASGIKSYADGVTGDNGYLFANEIKYALPSWDSPVGTLDQTLGVFLNYGAARPKDGSYTTIGEVAISDGGIAYSVTDKVYFARLQLAQALGTQKETATYNDKLKVLVQIGVRF